MKTRDSKGQNERWRGTNFVPQISVWFSEIIYCFFSFGMQDLLSVY